MRYCENPSCCQAEMDILVMERDKLREQLTNLQTSVTDKWDQLTSENQRLKDAIRKHRNQKGDNRCWLDDCELYEAIGDPPVHVEFCDPETMLENCKRFIAKRHDKEQPYVSPQQKLDELQEQLREKEQQLASTSQQLALLIQLIQECATCGSDIFPLCNHSDYRACICICHKLRHQSVKSVFPRKREIEK